MCKMFVPLLIPLFLLSSAAGLFAQSNARPAYLDPSRPLDERVADLVSRMTVDEKIGQLNYDAPAIERLGVPEYNWWNEALHGVARQGTATVFPQAIGLAATFDEDLIYRVATAISDEARAKFNAAQEMGNRGRYAGLTFWSPNVNIFRDPRWGRGQETYGEDPFLSGRIGAAFVRGLQGDHPDYLKTAACAKHYVVHSGPEGDRHHFNATPPRKDFQETYLPAFRELVTKAGVEAVMCAYNRTYDEPCCGSPFLLQEILREEWGFDGHVVSDCWALVDFHENHKVTDSPAESAALAYNAGVNVNCGSVSPYLKEALEKGLIREERIDEAVQTLLRTRFKLGLFDPPELVPYNQIESSVIHQRRHRDLAREAAAKSIVMLKNDDVLPLSRDIRKLYVIGPNATNGDVLLGNYYGVTPHLETILEGIAGAVSPGTTLEYKHGFLLDRENINPIDWTTGEAHSAEAIVLAMGLSGLLEGEEGESLASPTKSDRFEIRLPENQINYLRKIREAGEKPIIVVLTGGSPVANPELQELADAILYVWYPGQAGGGAIADVIFGTVSPSGRLPITFPRSVDQLPPYDDYSMVGRTYRYMEESPLYPFGFGLSYARFRYGAIQVSAREGGADVGVEVTNIGERRAEEVVQCYVSALETPFRVPRYDLRGFQRVALWPGETRTVRFTLSAEDLQVVNATGEWVVPSGPIRVTVAGASPGPRSQELGAPEPVSAGFRLK